MTGRLLDVNNDIVFSESGFLRATRGRLVVQQVRSNLLYYRAEWFLNRNNGVPYFQDVFVKPANLNLLESELKSTILNTPGVDSLISFSLDFDTSTRKVSVSFEARTIYNEDISDTIPLSIQV